MSTQDIVTQIEAALEGTTPAEGWTGEACQWYWGRHFRGPSDDQGRMMSATLTPLCESNEAARAKADRRLVLQAPTLLREAAATMTRLRAAAQAVVDESSADRPPSLGSIDQLRAALGSGAGEGAQR